MAITDLTGIPEGINRGVSSGKQATMLSLIGSPRGDYDDTCRDVTNPQIRDLILTDDVGTFRARGPGLHSCSCGVLLCESASTFRE
jgi:hypothetical protein